MAPDAVQGYPRWQGELSGAPRMLVIAVEETRRAWNNQWARTALMLAFAYAILTLGTLFSLRTRVGIHTMDALVEFLGLLRWAGLGLAAVAAGPALLEDAQRGALELYLSRAVTRLDYLAGKILSVFGLAFAAVAGPGLLYWLGSFVVFEDQPAGWAWAWAGILGYAILWALVVTGIGLGLSCVARSSRAASLILFGGIAGIDILFGLILGAITRDETVQVVSPMADLAQQVVWLFPGTEAPAAFPWWWGLIALGILLLVGWGLVWWRHPRLKGVE